METRPLTFQRIGIEAEYLLLDRSIEQLLPLDIPGVTSEFFRFMVEVTTDPQQTPSLAVAQLRQRVEALAAVAKLGRYASFVTQEPRITMADVTKDTDYYRWVFHEACRLSRCHPYELHYVGFHINVSDTLLDGDGYVRAANMLRCFNFLFPLLTANSPFREGKPCGSLSRRVLCYPNRYDVPLWDDERAFKSWMTAEEIEGRIYPGKVRCWMPVCPRLEHNDLDGSFERIELRSLDSGQGLPWSVLEGCCELALRFVQYSFEGRKLPATLAELCWNDKIVARFGRNAQIFLQGRSYNAVDVAQWWCKGIEPLEEVLATGSPAESALRAFAEQGKIPP